MVSSRHDRLDPIARGLRWQLDQLAACLPRRRVALYRRDEVLTASARLPSMLAIELPDEDCFVADIALPLGSPEAHRKAIELRLAELSPIPVDELSIAIEAVQSSPQAIYYRVTMARKSRLAAIERQASQRGATRHQFVSRIAGTPAARSVRSLARDRRQALINGALALVLVGCASAASYSCAARLNRETEAITAVERSLRRAVVAAEAARREADLAAELIAKGVLARRPGAALDAIANVGAVTPDETWWSMIRWNPEEILISAESLDATAALQRLSEDALRWRVEPVGSISAPQPGAPQTFEARLKRREATP